MADLLSTSVSGLLAFQRALDTTSHNISNANTPGYSRQVVDFGTRSGQASSGGWVGNGVQVNTIERAYDDFLAGQSRTASSAYQQFDTYTAQATRINNLLSDSSTGLTSSLQRFINAIQGVADSPTSIPARQTLLSEAQSLVQRMQSYDTSLGNFEAQVNARLETEATAISTLAQSIAKLNQEISGGYSRTGQPPNDLLDQRDRLVSELATHVSVNVVPQGDHSVNVFIGNGQPLVVGQTPARLVATADPYDPTRKALSFQTASGTVDITRSLSGGSVGGLFEFRNQMLDPARNALGRLSVGLAELMNEQHGAGMTLQGAPGGDFFAVGGVLVQPNAFNTGSGNVTVQRTQPSAAALSTSDYVLTNTNGGWTLHRADTGATVAMTGTGTGADPFVAEGMSIVIDPGADVGDRFRIEPTSNAISGLRSLITNPADIAAGAPIVAAVGGTNAGNATISRGQVLDASNGNLTNAVTITFTSATEYTISGDPTVYTYAPGDNIDANGWRVQISGSPAAGDTFTVRSNAGGNGDNRNALMLADVLSQPILGGGTTSLNAAVGQFVGDIGVKTNQVQVSRDAQKLVYEESVGALESVAGVNLDEEAANLVRYQQAYMAAAQMIRVADTIFQSILDATRG